MTERRPWRAPWYAVLLAWIPPLFVWSGSPAEVEPRDVLVHVALGTALAAGAIALFTRPLGPLRGGLAASLLVVGLTWPLEPVVAVLLPLVGIPLLFRLGPGDAESGRFSLPVLLNVLAVATALTSLGSVFLHYASGTSFRPAPKPVAQEARSRPDVWWIVLDGFSRPDWLEKRFGVEDVLGPGLEKRGFQVARSSRANYPQTLYVVSSTLNLDYVQSLAGRAEVPQDVVHALLRENVVAATFRAAGYRTVFWPGGYHRLEPGLEQVRTAAFLPSEFHLALMNQWPPVGLWRMTSGRSLSTMLRHRFAVRTMEALSAVEDGPPTFSFLHVVAPHAPFVIGPDGSEAATGNADTIMDGSAWVAANPGRSYRRGYAGQAVWVQPAVLAVVDRILAPGARPAVVVVCSDHGSGLALDWNRMTREALADRMSAFWAVHVPGGASSRIPATISTVNTFRYVFDEVFGTDLGLLPDRSYWQTWDRPERLTDVTRLAHGPG